LLRLKLSLGQSDHIFPADQVPEEELERTHVAKLRRRGFWLGQPFLELSAALLGDRVDAAPTAPALPLLAQESHLDQALRLRVELRVRKRPEVADREPDQALQVVGGRLAEQGNRAQKQIRGRGEF